MKRIIVHYEKELTEVAVLENERLTDFYVERTGWKQKAGNIYKGRIVNVLPGMQSVFVNIGMDKNAFLYIDDVLPANSDKRPDTKPAISELLSIGQELIVQVVKEASGTKGARVTTHCSIPGKTLVYMPGADYVGVSRKIELENKRNRLKMIAESIRLADEGLVLRTAAEDLSEEELVSELSRLRKIWSEVLENAEYANAPQAIYKELDVIARLVRDVLSEDVCEIIVGAYDQGREIKKTLLETAPELEQRIKPYRDATPIFRHYKVYEELDKILKRKIWLPSGAYLVVEHTEALTVIDVNTGKFTGSVNLEQTVYDTNMEATREISRIIRLRDLAGIIIVDFIDMDEEENRHRIVKEMESLFRQDRMKTLVIGWTRLGLLEITRKKTREPLDDLFFETCNVCQGRGKLYSTNHPHRFL